MSDALQIPADLLPADGRFGAGPSKIQTSHLDALAATGSSLLGTSHRQAPVKNTVGRVREGLAALFALPDGYEVVLGNGGATAFWDIATFGLIREKSQHLSFGEFSSKFAKAAQAGAVAGRPVGDRVRRRARVPTPVAEDGVDAYAWAHNETSTAVMAPVRRPAGAADDALVLVDATSGAGGLPVDLDRGRRLLLRAAEVLRLRRRPLDRADVAAARWRGSTRSRRPTGYVPAFFDLPTAIDNSRKNQTYNTPSVATLFLMAEQLDWMNAQGGLAGMVERTTASSDALYGWAEQDAVHHAVRREPGPPLAGDRHHRLRRRRSTPPRSPRPCGPTGSSTPSPTASSAATSCGSRCTPRSTRPTSRR